MINFFEPVITGKAIKLVEETLRSGYINCGPRVKEFERILTNQWYFTNPLMTSSCTAALHMALLLSDVKKGDEVILPAQTFIATGLAVLMCGAKPVFCDITKYGLADFEDVTKKITSKTKAIITVDWAGQIICPFYLKTFLSKLCPNIKLIADRAHSFGSDLVGRCISYDFECFSLQAIKTCVAGDAGILCINDESLINRAKELRWFGCNKDEMTYGQYGERKWNVKELGYKYNPTDIDASLAIGNLEAVKSIIEDRKKISLIYQYILQEYVNVLGISHFGISSTFWFQPILVHDRDLVIKNLRKSGYPATIWDTRIDEHKVFGKNRRNLSGQNYYSQHVVDLPCHHKMEPRQAEEICKIIKESF